MSLKEKYQQTLALSQTTGQAGNPMFDINIELKEFF
jgi:hypothetical protein